MVSIRFSACQHLLPSITTTLHRNIGNNSAHVAEWRDESNVNPDKMNIVSIPAELVAYLTDRSWRDVLQDAY